MTRTPFATVILLLLVSNLPFANVQGEELWTDPSFGATVLGTPSNPFWKMDVRFPDDGAEPAAQFQDAPWASNPAGMPGVDIWNQAVDATVDVPANAIISEDVSAIPVTEYTHTSFFRRETFYTSLAKALGRTIMRGGTNQDAVATGRIGIAPADKSWNQYVIVAAALTGTDTVRVLGNMIDGVAGAGNPQSTTWGDLSLTAVVIPEPGTGVMALLVGAWVVFVRRRR